MKLKKHGQLFLTYIKYLRRYERVREEFKREVALQAALIELKTGRKL